MGTITCTACGYQNDSKRYFCQKCNKFLLTPDSEEVSISAEAELKLSRITANLKGIPHVDILWNDTVDAYTRKVEKIQSLLKLQEIGINSSELTNKIDRFLNICRNPDFEIAFVGAVKAGKSTLINALLGRNYASTDPNPETAVLTKFRSSERDYINVKFYSTAEWNDLFNSAKSDAEGFLRLYNELDAEKHKKEWIDHKAMHIDLANSAIEDELKKWSSSQSAVHFFVKELEVGISSLSSDFPKQVVFVDTPGLFDPVAYRSQISIDYIRNANAVLVCIKAEDLHGEEVKTVESVFSFSGHKRNKVFIIATNWDKLNNVIIDWEKRYNYMINSFTGKAFFPTREMAQSNILYADPYHYNLCRDYNSLDRLQRMPINVLLTTIQSSIYGCLYYKKSIPDNINELEYATAGMLSPANIRNLMEVTNVRVVNNVISTELVNQYAELLYSDIKNQYEDILHMVNRIAGERHKTIAERITISYSDLEGVKRNLEEKKKNRDEIQIVQNQLTAALNSLNKKTQQRLDEVKRRISEINV